MIKTGRVRVNGHVVVKPSKAVTEEDVIELDSKPPASRGAHKLEAVLTGGRLDVQGRKVLDVGCSTGGFTEVFLRMGARSVTAVDIARDILHPELRAQPNVRFFGNVDARSGSSLRAALGSERFHIISIDVSRVHPAELLEALTPFLRKGGVFLLLFKPTYVHGHPARTPEELERMSRDFADSLEGQYRVRYQIDSPLRGGTKGHGTLERFFVLELEDPDAGLNPPRPPSSEER